MSLFPYLNVNGLEVRSCSHCSLFLIPKMDLPSNITWQSWSLEMHVDPWDAWALKRLSFRADDKTFRVSNYWLMCYSNCDSGVWVYYKNSRALDSFAIYLNRMGDTRNIFTTSELFQASISSFLLFFYRFQMKWNLLFESLIFWQLLLPYFQLLTEMLYDTLHFKFRIPQNALTVR